MSRAISAFANASGGELIIGMEEVAGPNGTEWHWDGFENEEAANDFLQVIHQLDDLQNTIFAQFLEAKDKNGLLLHLTISKSADIKYSTDGKCYIRKGAQSLLLNDAALERLKFEKGIQSYEDQIVNEKLDEITNSATIIDFMLQIIPSGEPKDWLDKQKLIIDEKPNVAGILLFSDNPQSILPKRSAVKILRYKTKEGAERDFLDADPETIEGPIYSLIYDTVDRTKNIIEGIEKLGPEGMEKVIYPQEALHELVTNAILHRDYSIPQDVQIRIFDNRVEIESPGKLPGHVTTQNIAKTQFARNPKIVRLVNKFKNPPNKDVGEGVNTAFEAMEKLRLKKPEFLESESGLLVTLKHESLDSPASMVLEYLYKNDEITNQQARELTGIRSENTMKNVFYKLRDAGKIEPVPKIAGKKYSWRKTNSAS